MTNLKRLRVLHCHTLKLSQLAQILRWPVAIQNGDLLAPRRQERQVRKFNFFAAFAPLREIFRVLVQALRRGVLRGEPSLPLTHGRVNFFCRDG